MTILATFLMKALELPTRRALALIVIVSLSVGVLLAGDDQPPAPLPDGTGWLPSSSEGLPQPLVRAVRASPHAFFRLANRAWASRVCAAFANDLRSLDQVRLHGDAHVEQYAVTDSAYGLDDFDDTAEGPSVIDIVRFPRITTSCGARAGLVRSVRSPRRCLLAGVSARSDHAGRRVDGDRGAKAPPPRRSARGAATAPAAGAQPDRVPQVGRWTDETGVRRPSRERRIRLSKCWPLTRRPARLGAQPRISGSSDSAASIWASAAGACRNS